MKTDRTIHVVIDANGELKAAFFDQDAAFETAEHFGACVCPLDEVHEVGPEGVTQEFLSSLEAKE